jgi:GntR family transcriptional regulator/MocR family aminotransferase
MRKIRNAKCEAFVRALKDGFGDSLRVSGAHGGLHLFVRPGWPATETSMVESARRAGVGVCPASVYWSEPDKCDAAALLLNYGGVPLRDIPAAVERLYDAWRNKVSGAMQKIDCGSLPCS